MMQHLEITGLQLEVGSVATDFEHRSFAQELELLCQVLLFNKYCLKSTDGTVDKCSFSNLGQIGQP